MTQATVIAAGRPGEIKYKDRRLLVLHFDMTAMPLPDQMRAQDSALRFVSAEMTAADTVAVMSFTSRLNLLQDFTADRTLISKAITSLFIGEGSDLAATTDDASVTGAAYTADDTEFEIFNADRKLVALQSAIKALGALPEKKGLMYFSSGFTKSGLDNEAQMRATTNAAIRYNVSLFPVDARARSAAIRPYTSTWKPLSPARPNRSKPRLRSTAANPRFSKRPWRYRKRLSSRCPRCSPSS